MTLSAKWRNRAAEGTTSERNCVANIANIDTIPQAKTAAGNSGDCGDYGDRFTPPALGIVEGPADLPWPMPEPGPIETVTPAGRYACLFALASHFGAGLTKEAGGGLTLACPATMPQEAARAARDGLAELAGHLQMRLSGGT